MTSLVKPNWGPTLQEARVGRVHEQESRANRHHVADDGSGADRDTAAANVSVAGAAGQRRFAARLLPPRWKTSLRDAGALSAVEARSERATRRPNLSRFLSLPLHAVLAGGSTCCRSARVSRLSRPAGLVSDDRSPSRLESTHFRGAQPLQTRPTLLPRLTDIPFCSGA